jgi:malonate decarboxylase gamma subunit
MSATITTQNLAATLKGQFWFDALTIDMVESASPVASVRIADGKLGDNLCRFIVVQPDANNLYPRARNGEVGLLEGWSIAKAVNQIILESKDEPIKKAIIAIVDVPSQAYGRREEALGIHQALAASVSAYANARLNGHPVLALLTGKAMSGAFLAHGYQANQIFALDDPAVQVHAMGKAAAARITLRTEEQLDQLASDIPPMAYDLQSYTSLGMVEKVIKLKFTDTPDTEDIDNVSKVLADALTNIDPNDTSLSKRFNGINRAASRSVRKLLKEQWGN